MSDPAAAVAVIIISYNGERHLRKSIASVLNQTAPDFELVVVEDGSRDGAESIVASFHDPRLRYLWQPNAGPNAARNTGIAATTAPLIAFLDCDDWWAPEKLAAQLDALKQRPDAGVAYSAAMMVNEGTDEMALDPALVEGDVTEALLIRNCIPGSASSVLVRRDVISRVGLYDETIRFAEDWEYWLRLAAATPFARVTVPHVFINVRPDSSGRNTEALRLGAHAVVERAFARAEPKYQRLRRAALANIEFGASVDLAHHGKRRQAIVPLLRAIRHDPFRARFWRRLILIVLTKLWPSQNMRRRIVAA
jgi:glycosyltransferase involved in cell wall biosynthesis